MSRISMTVDGVRYDDDVEPRTLLVHHLRELLGKVGTVVGCDTSNCGACTVLLGGPRGGRGADGTSPPTATSTATSANPNDAGPDQGPHSVKSCTVLAVQADGRDVTTVEGLADAAGAHLHPLQRAFHERHALQCGFCTPGMMMAAVDLLADNPDPTDAGIREGLEGNLCRCTGYQNIVHAVHDAASELRAGASSGTTGDKAAAPEEMAT